MLVAQGTMLVVEVEVRVPTAEVVAEVGLALLVPPMLWEEPL